MNGVPLASATADSPIADMWHDLSFLRAVISLVTLFHLEVGYSYSYMHLGKYSRIYQSWKPETLVRSMSQRAAIDQAERESSTSDALFGLVGCVAEQLPQSSRILPQAAQILDTSLDVELDQQKTQGLSDEDGQRRLSTASLLTAREMCRTATRPTLKRKQSWQALQESSQRLHGSNSDTDANALAISFVYGALSLLANDNELGESAKAAASATTSTVSRNKPLRNVGRGVANDVLKSYMLHASHSDELNLHTLAQFAKAFQINEKQEPVHAELSAQVIRHALQNSPPSSIDGQEDSIAADYENRKRKVSGALAIATQLGPWPLLSPVPLVEAAIPFDFWPLAERICVGAHHSAKEMPVGTNQALGDSSLALPEAVRAVENLIDAAMEAKMYRRADTLATNLYKQGGKSRFIEARFHHACETIAKVARKRKFPIIDRQVERIDKAVERVHGSKGVRAEGDQDGFSPCQDIRDFALSQLEEAGEVDAAHRLASQFGMDYVRDEKALQEAAAMRRKRYLQFEDFVPSSLPDLISDPDTLRATFDTFWKNGRFHQGPFGMDAEWEEDSPGVDVLQLASLDQAILVDIPGLAASVEGVTALKDTVGALFSCPDTVVVGFACRQDVSRLRKSSSATTKTEWLTETTNVVDVQKVIGEREPSLNILGLSRVCQHYLGKPLDKAEQCSCWGARPLSPRQRSYAALDAWVCARIYKLLHDKSSIQSVTSKS